MRRGKGIRIVQASPADPARAIEAAWTLGCTAIAWDLRQDCHQAVRAASAARLRSEGWYSVARDQDAAAAHPEWMHSPRRKDWCGGHSGSLIAPYIGLNNLAAAEYAKAELMANLERNEWCNRLWLADIQGPPMGCGCPSLSCRSWDDSPGAKVVDESPFDLPDRFFSEMFFESLVHEVWNLERPLQVVPILCPGCERGMSLGHIPDPDGPAGTNRCVDAKCAVPCSGDYWPTLLQRFLAWRGSLFVPHIGLLLLCDGLERNHPVYGAPRSWPILAHSHYGQDLLPCIEPEDADKFRNCLIALDAPQNVWPVDSPSGYEISLATVNS